MRRINQENWIAYFNHHMQQFSKGILVSLFTFAGYGLAKSLGGGVSAEMPTTDSQNQVLPIASRKSTVDVAREISELNALTGIEVSSPMGVESQKSFAINSKILSDVNKQPEKSLAEELGIDFYSQNEVSKISELSDSSGKSTRHEINFSNSATSEIVVTEGEEFYFKIPGYDIDPDGKTYFLGAMCAKQTDGSSLPTWMQWVGPVPFNPPLIGNYPISQIIPNDIIIKNSLAFLWVSIISQPFFLGNLVILNITNTKTPTYVGHIAWDKVPGIYWHDIEVCESLIFIGTEDHLSIFDVTHPQAPVNVKHQPMTDGVTKVIAQGSLLFVTTKKGLQILNITNPKIPTQVGTYATFSGANSISVQDSLAFIATDKGLTILNITNIRTPVWVGDFNTSSVTLDVIIQKPLAFLRTKSGLQLLNITNPRIPAWAGNFSLQGNVKVQGSLAFVAYGNLQILNVTNPKSITRIGSFPTPGAASIAMQKLLAFIADASGIRIFDLKEWGWVLRGLPPLYSHKTYLISVQAENTYLGIKPYYLKLRVNARPRVLNSLVSKMLIPGEMLSYRFNSDTFMDPEGDSLWFSSLDFSLADGSPLPAWLKISFQAQGWNYPNLNNIKDIEVQEPLAFMISGKRLQIFNITSCNNVVPVANYTFDPIVVDKDAKQISVEGSLVFITTLESLYILNVTNPRLPTVESALSANYLGWVEGIAAQGSLLYLATSTYEGWYYSVDGGIKILNITDPSNPILIGSDIGDFHTIVIKEPFSFLTSLNLVTNSLNLVIYNITNPKAPSGISSYFPNPGTVSGIAVRDSLIFVAADSGGLQIVNISNPKTPTQIGNYLTPGYAATVVIQGPLAFIAAGSEGIQILNITDPQQPTWVGSYLTEQATNIAIKGECALVADGIGGLKIVDIGLGAWVLSGQSGSTEHSKYHIAVTARDHYSAATTTTFWLSINNPPVWVRPVAIKTIYVGQVLSFQLPGSVFYDKDGDTLTFNSTLSNGTSLPPWITFFSLGQIYTIVPLKDNRGLQNISIMVEDGYFGTASAWFLVDVPFRKPIKINDVPSQGMSLWRHFALHISPKTVFEDLDVPDLSELTFSVQLSGKKSLPGWLNFHNVTCDFSGTPGILDIFHSLEVIFVASNPVGKNETANFNIAIDWNVLLQDIATCYSVSGGILVFLNLLMRLWRWQKMRVIHQILRVFSEPVDEKLSSFQGMPQNVKNELQNLLVIVEQRETQALKKQVQQYGQQALAYARQQQGNVLEAASPWKVIRNICEEIENRAVHRFSYQDTLLWVQALHQLLQIIVQAQAGQGRTIRKSTKEQLLELLNKAEKYIDLTKVGIEIKHQLQLCHEALVSMDDTDSIKDNLRYHDWEMFIEILKIMLAPPYGAVRLLYQFENIPSGWYPIIIQMFRLAEQALTSSEKLSDLQTTLSQQKDWRVIYAGVSLLVMIATETHEEKIREQVVKGVRLQTKGLRYYQKYSSVWGSYLCCCDRESQWIRKRAKEVKGIDQDDLDDETAVKLHPLQERLLQS